VPADIIYRDVEHALQQGCLEIQLTAQDIASYGSDTDESLGTLLDHLSSIHGLYRIRVGMMNPRSVLTQMNDIINGMNNISVFKFLHLPVQSGDDTILANDFPIYDLFLFSVIDFEKPVMVRDRCFTILVGMKLLMVFAFVNGRWEYLVILMISGLIFLRRSSDF
ncbi:unnamed protein product, partial [marine sediment metagenome]